MTEHRQYRRIDFHSEADIHINNRVQRCELVDLALQGALFRCEHALPISLGEQAGLSIFLPETALQMKFVGELIHQQGDFYGFLFISEDAESMGHLRRLLELNFGDDQQAEGEFSHWLKQKAPD